MSGLADNHLQPESFPDMSKWETRLVSYGLAAAISFGAVINAEFVETFHESKKRLETDRKDDEDKRPPKPPRPPNARFTGRLALGNI